MEKYFETLFAVLVSYLLPRILDPVFKPKEPKSAERGFPWFWWLAAHAIGGAAGGTLSAALGVQGFNTPGGLANWAAYGTCLGIAQWFVLQRERQTTPLWAVASTLGWSVFAYFQAVQAPGPVGWVCTGLAVGILQWPILAKRRAWVAWWVPANGAAWFVGSLVGIAAGLLMLQSHMSLLISWVLGWSLVGLVGSFITGLAIASLPRK